MISRPRPVAQALALTVLSLVIATAACTSSDGPGGDGDGDGGTKGEGDGYGDGDRDQSARALAARLGRPANLLIGLGNDLAGAELNYNHNQDGAYTLGVTLDLHYAYLTGDGGGGWGWPTWNAPRGQFVRVMTDTADANGVVPMFILYQHAANGDGNLSSMTDPAYMSALWADTKLLFQHLAAFDKPVVVVLEPDFWGYANVEVTARGGSPADFPILVKNPMPDCAHLTDDVRGMLQCQLHLARTLAPKAVIGVHASRWGAPLDPHAHALFLKSLGADQMDVLFVEALDRDAGCFEAHTDPGCQRNDGPWYWDESNATSPNFHEHFAMVKDWHETLSLPIIWWQVPLGVPSDTPGGISGAYRDNRVRYFFEHPEELVAAGGVAATFGVGAVNQTDHTTDGDQFKRAVQGYYQAPVPLP
jgi:hypothetical protein